MLRRREFLKRAGLLAAGSLFPKTLLDLLKIREAKSSPKALDSTIKLPPEIRVFASTHPYAVWVQDGVAVENPDAIWQQISSRVRFPISFAEPETIDIFRRFEVSGPRTHDKTGDLLIRRPHKLLNLKGQEPFFLRVSWYVEDAKNSDEDEYYTGVRITEVMSKGHEMDRVSFTWQIYGIRQG